MPLLWREMARLCNQLGFGAVSYNLLRTGSAQPAAVPLHHGFLPVEIETYLALDFQRLNIVPRIALALGRPVRWSETWQTFELTPDEREFVLALRAVNFPDGITLPCFGPHGRNATVALGHVSEGVDLGDANLVRLQYIAQAVHLRICDLFATDIAIGRHLSSREKEILDWVARGKSNGVIADILAISSSTVDTYMRRIYDKLDVSDRTSAAVKGLGLGLIAA